RAGAGLCLRHGPRLYLRGGQRSRRPSSITPRVPAITCEDVPHATLRGVKVATRITVATAVVVALASAAYAYFDLRARRAQRQRLLAEDARGVAGVLRLQLEAQGSGFRVPSDAQLERWHMETGWTVVVVPQWRADNPTDTSAQTRWLRVFIDEPNRPPRSET